MENIRNSLLNRFIKYVKTYSQSDSNKADEGVIPSTPQQFEIAKILCEELKALGLENSQKALAMVQAAGFVKNGEVVAGKPEWVKG